MAKKGKIENKFPLRDTEERPVRQRKYKYWILIVCEDEKTEPYYFETIKKQFPDETVFIRPFGTGRSSKGVVEKAIEEKQKLYKESNKDVDEVWAVFDKDDAEQSQGNMQRFEEAFCLAEKEGVKVAYSNEVFELWLLLHFIDVSSEKLIPRKEIYSQLEICINKGRTNATQFVYEHGDTKVIDIVIRSGNETKAIERADRLNAEHERKKHTPIEANPNTKVNTLVKSLREHIQYYSYTPDI